MHNIKIVLHNTKSRENKTFGPFDIRKNSIKAHRSYFSSCFINSNTGTTIMVIKKDVRTNPEGSAVDNCTLEWIEESRFYTCL